MSGKAARAIEQNADIGCNPVEAGLEVCPFLNSKQ